MRGPFWVMLLHYICYFCSVRGGHLAHVAQYMSEEVFRGGISLQDSFHAIVGGCLVRQDLGQTSVQILYVVDSVLAESINQATILVTTLCSLFTVFRFVRS